jgi:hypothetical protein
MERLFRESDKKQISGQELINFPSFVTAIMHILTYIKNLSFDVTEIKQTVDKAFDTVDDILSRIPPVLNQRQLMEIIYNQ